MVCLRLGFTQGYCKQGFCVGGGHHFICQDEPSGIKQEANAATSGAVKQEKEEGHPVVGFMQFLLSELGKKLMTSSTAMNPGANCNTEISASFHSITRMH